MTEASAPVARTACATVSKIGMPSKSVPPRPGVTPATICVPYSRQRRVCSWPVAPVMPWVRTRVRRSTSTLIGILRSRSWTPPRGRDCLPRAVEHVAGGDDVEPGAGEDRLALVDVRALHADDQRDREADLARGLDDAVGQNVAAEDAAEDVDEDRPHGRVRQEDPERGRHLFRRGATAD